MTGESTGAGAGARSATWPGPFFSPWTAGGSPTGGSAARPSLVVSLTGSPAGSGAGALPLASGAGAGSAFASASSPRSFPGELAWPLPAAAPGPPGRTGNSVPARAPDFSPDPGAGSSAFRVDGDEAEGAGGSV